MKAAILAIVFSTIMLFVGFVPRMGEAVLDHYLPKAPVASSTGDLSALVPAGTKTVVGDFYRDMAAAVVKSDKVQTTDQLRDGYRLASSLAQANGGLPTGLDKLDQEVNSRYDKAVGLSSTALTPELRGKIADVWKGVAADLGVK